MIQTILTPIDGSEHAKMAVDLSTDLAARYDAQLILLHVGGGDGDVPQDLYDAASRELEQAERDGLETGVHAYQPRYLQVVDYMGHMLLRMAKERAGEESVKRVETVFEYGDAGERIIQCAKDKSADLIVMGSRGFGELKGLVLGSVSHKVFHLAPCSCVTVNRKAGQPALDGVGSILVATDGSGPANRAVDLASDIAGTYDAELALLYVMSRGPSLDQLRASIDMGQLGKRARDELDPTQHPIAEHASSSFFSPVVSKRTLKEIGKQVLERGQRTAQAKGVRSTKLVLREGDPARVIVNMARRHRVDMVAIGSRGLGRVEGLLTGSVSYKVSHTVPCSCMIVR